MPVACTFIRRPVAQSRTRRIAFVVLFLIVLYAVSELCAWTAFRLAFGAWFSLANLDAERQDCVPQDHRVARPGYMSLCVLHPYLGWVINPTAANTCGPDFTPQGFYRLDEPIQKRAKHKVIIGIAGGSVAYLFANHGIPVLRQALQSSPRYAGKDLVFVNLAQGGYKQPQQLMALNYFLSLGAEFDILINIDGFNEVALYDALNAKQHVFPIYPPNWHLLCNVPEPAVMRLIAQVTTEERCRSAWARRWGRAPWRYSMTANFLWKWHDQRVQNTISKLQSDIASHTGTANYQALGPGNAASCRAATEDELIAIWNRCSIQLERLCRANGIAYYQFLQPNQYVANSKPIGEAERQIAIAEHHSYRTSVEECYPRLQAVGRDLHRQGVHFRDLTMIFAEHAEAIYTDRCCHFNAHGSQIMAQIIADTISATVEPPVAAD
jgi:hypothetical protein